MLFTPDIIAEMELLALYNLDNHQEGLKVHHTAGDAKLAAVTRLYEKGLTSESDGGYLTSLGIDAAEHAQNLLTILGDQSSKH